jgi:hypothetical protein
MKTPTWAFALLRFGLIALIYSHFAPRYGLLSEQPLLFYGLPFFMLLAVLGIHRHWMFALGTLLLCTSFADLAPEIFKMDRFRFFALGLVTFFLGFTPCDRDYSVRSLWNAGNKDFFEFKAAPELTWNLYRLLVCFFYARFLLTKTNAGFFHGNYIWRNVFVQNWGADFLFQRWFLVLCVAVAVLLYALNVAFSLAVWFPRSYRWFVALAVPYHAVFLVLTQFSDMTHFLHLILLLPFAVYGLSFKVSKVLTAT